MLTGSTRAEVESSRGTPVIPMRYHSKVQLPGPLAQRHALDFSDSRKRPWGELFAALESIAHDRELVAPTHAGVKSVALSRDALLTTYTIASVIERAAPRTTISVVARTAEAWAREFDRLTRAVAERGCRLEIGVVGPKAPATAWLVASDYAQTDLAPSIDKLRQIKLTSDSQGSVEVRGPAASPLLSHMRFTDVSGVTTGVLEAGASLSLDERVSIILTSMSATSRPSYRGVRPDVPEGVCVWVLGPTNARGARPGDVMSDPGQSAGQIVRGSARDR
jgi:hypothetical protein